MLDLRRRGFIMLLGSAAAWPIAARAQQTERMRRICVLIGYAEGDPETTSRLAAFRQGLERRKWAEGRNVHIDYRFAAASADQYRALAKEMIALKPDVILAHTTAITATLQRESSALPIVFVNVSDPVGSGFIASLARPGGNITGVMHYEAGIVGKWLGLLKEIAPGLTRAAILANPRTTPYDYFFRAAQVLAPSLAIELVSSPVEDAAGIERSIQSLAREPNGGLVIPPDATTVVHRDLVIALAARHRLPTVYTANFWVESGGLMSYGTDQVNMFRQAAGYVDRILHGDKPADLPVQAPTKYETAINLKTARALGLTVPPGLLVAADEVIE
jgi:putative ABC transport system substrate-binding protein